jgi:O-succinylbenzoate synthase
LAPVGLENLRLAAAAMAARGDVAGAPPLSQELFDQAQAHRKACGRPWLATLARVARRHDPLAQIHIESTRMGTA